MGVCDLQPFLYDQVPAPEDVSGLQLSQEQLQSYLKQLLDEVCVDITALQSAGGGGGATTFLGLTDTPSSYAGSALRGVRVNAGATGLEFAVITAVEQEGLTLDYSTSEQTTSRTYTGGETIFQKTVVFGALPNNTTKTVAHNIAEAFRIIRFEFVCRRVSDGVQVVVPNVSNTSIGAQTQLSFTTTNIVARNSVNSSAFVGDITLFYIKL